MKVFVALLLLVAQLSIVSAQTSSSASCESSIEAFGCVMSIFVCSMSGQPECTCFQAAAMCLEAMSCREDFWLGMQLQCLVSNCTWCTPPDESSFGCDVSAASIECVRQKAQCSKATADECTCIEQEGECLRRAGCFDRLWRSHVESCAEESCANCPGASGSGSGQPVPKSSSSPVVVEESSSPVVVKESSSPVVVKESSSPVVVKESSSITPVVSKQSSVHISSTVEVVSSIPPVIVSSPEVTDPSGAPSLMLGAVALIIMVAL